MAKRIDKFLAGEANRRNDLLKQLRTQESLLLRNLADVQEQINNYDEEIKELYDAIGVNFFTLP